MIEIWMELNVISDKYNNIIHLNAHLCEGLTNNVRFKFNVGGTTQEVDI
jgi:hypothetical protein